MNILSQAYVDGLYEDFLRDPGSIATEWKHYFDSLTANGNLLSHASPLGLRGHSPITPPPTPISARPDFAHPSRDMSIAHLQDRVDQLIRSYRVRGHLAAQIDPLGMPRPSQPELDAESHGLLPSDMQRHFSTRTINGTNVRTLSEIITQLRNTYCRFIGVQFMHIDDFHVRDWLQQQMEGTENRIQLSRAEQLRILTKLTDAVIFEEFVRRKFVGAKTFSLEGAESLIPLLDLALEKAGEQNIAEVIIGMAHRGRLNVLANIMGKRSENIFWSFDDPDPETHRGGGDVLYHLGYSNDWKTSSGKKVHLSLCFNPSHLEFVNPVAIGRCRSKQDRYGDHDRKRAMTILIHGDAAFAGEGIIQETFNLSELKDYKVGGTLHVIVNNQVGFTTPAFEGRSTTYASDVAKMLQIPIFHVNGEDPEAVAQVVKLSMDFRYKFQRDVVIDMYCYRRLGHNESDEPRFTQPLMYKIIDERPTVRDSYCQRLLKLGGVTQEEADLIAETRKGTLEAEFKAAQSQPYRSDTQTLTGVWSGYYGGAERLEDDPDTGCSAEILKQVIAATGTITKPGFHVNPKLKRMLQQRIEMAESARPIDWATAELAAFGSLVLGGTRVRLSGQDCGRGTFSQRHAILHDCENGERYHVLNHLASNQNMIDIINSPLCETAVLGFEYGYSLDYPDALICWEAQFGDFWNVAQVIVDQFITSAEDKWRRFSSLVMLLPHGFEGAGPEHCSARVERFLTLAAEHNIQIASPTTAAQYFHLLRRQVIRKWRKPLIVLTPKSLLREELVMSPFADFTRGRFKRTISDPMLVPGCKPDRVLLTTGKIGVELIKERQQQGVENIAIVRVEQLYPLPLAELQSIFEHVPDETEVAWVQEEPSNMGAWQFIKVNFGDRLFGRFPLQRISRQESASPSTGSKKMHKIEQAEVLEQALGVPLQIAH